MVRSHVLSRQEKLLALIGAALLLIFVVVGYTKARSGAETSVLLAQDAADIQNQQNHLKNQRDYVNNLRREMRDAQRDAKQLDVTKVSGLIDLFEQCINTLQTTPTAEFWSATRDCNDRSRDVEDAKNELNDARNFYQNGRNIQDRKKEFKNNVERQIKDILRNNKSADVTPLTTIKAQIDAQFAKADPIMVGVPSRDNADLLQDIQNELNTLFQDFYSSSGEVNQKANDENQKVQNEKWFKTDVVRQCDKDMTRELRNLERDVKRAEKAGVLSAELQAEIQAVKDGHTKLCVEIKGSMAAALEKGADGVQDFNDLRMDFQNGQQELFYQPRNEAAQKVNEEIQKIENLKNAQRDLKDKSRQLADMKRNLSRTRKLYDRFVKKFGDREDRKSALSSFASIIQESEALISRIEEGLKVAAEEAASDPDSYWYDRTEEFYDYQNDFNEVQNQVNTVLNFVQILKDMDRNEKNTQRELSKVKRESKNNPDLIGKLEDILLRRKEAVSQAISALANDPEEAVSIIQSLYEYQNEWVQTINEWRGVKSKGFDDSYEGYVNNPGAYMPPPPLPTPSPPPLPSTEATSSAF